MTSMTSKCVAAVAFAMLAAPVAAWAEDFNLEVPIELSRLPPEVTGLTVNCLVTNMDGSTRSGDPGYRVIGDGSARAPITGGSFHDSVFVRFNARPGTSASAARYYSCGLNLTTGRAAYTYGEIAAGRAFPLSGPATTDVRGLIPR